MGEEKEILLRGKVCAYLTGRLMGDPDRIRSESVPPARIFFFCLQRMVNKGGNPSDDAPARQPPLTIENKSITHA